MSSLCIAHVSDTHVMGTAEPYRGVYVDARTRSVFERIVDEGRADLIAHTGDVIARDADPLTAYGFYRRLLQAAQVPVLHIPGNHDRVDLWSDGVSPRAEAVFPSEPAWAADVGGCRLIGCDSSSGLGRVPPLTARSETRAARRTASAAARAGANPPVVVLVHHHLTPLQTPWLDADRLRNPGEFTSALVSAGFWPDVILHGHVHTPFRHSVEIAGRQTPVLSAPAASFGFRLQTESYTQETSSYGFQYVVLQRTASGETRVRVDPVFL